MMLAARERLSTDSRRSLANRWIAKDFAELSSRLLWSCRFLKSCNDFSYLSCGRLVEERKVLEKGSGVLLAR